MPFAIDPGLPLDAEVRRVGLERLDLAIAELTALADGTADDVVTAVHSVRKRCKEVRALARLARRPLGADFDVFNDLVRSAANELSARRDAHAMLATLDNLRAGAGAAGDADLGVVHEIHAALTAEEAAGLHGDDPTISHALARLREARDRCAEWTLDSSDWLASGLASTYRAGRQALRRAHHKNSDARMHDWRKQVKKLWYQLRLIEAASPGVLGPLIARFDDLGETLGDHHDLAVLIDRLESCGNRYGAKKQVRHTVARARARQLDLASRAFRLGAGLYGERTSAFTARIMHYWTTTVELGPEPEPAGIAALVAAERHDRRTRPAAASRESGASGTADGAGEPAATVERERKFVVDRLPDLLDTGVDLRQGYLAIDGSVSVRVRDAGPGGYTMTVKGGRGAVRAELEWALTNEQFEAAWAHTEHRRITKTRYCIALGTAAAAPVMVDLDVFHGDLEGLVVAEVEFDSDEAMCAFTPPDWFGREVTDDTNFANAALATRVTLGRLLG